MNNSAQDSLLWRIVNILWIPGIIFSVFLMIWLRSGITSLEYSISELEMKKLQLLNLRKELVVRRSDILSVKNVEKIAVGKLGLSFPDRRNVIYVKRDEEPFNFKAGYER